jgi:cytoplasmic iron level regulating protein YaaA (DUF328/UPF0246 family)
MKHIILISCVSKKQSMPSKAQDLYISTLFRKNLAFAKTLNPDQIFILSAKYGLVGLDEVIEPYDLTLNTMPAREIRQWALRVLSQLTEHTDLQNDEFIFLAGEKYRKYLLPHIKQYEIPLQGLKIGEQLQRLTQLIEEAHGH